MSRYIGGTQELAERKRGKTVCRGDVCDARFV